MLTLFNICHGRFLILSMSKYNVEHQNETL